METLHTALTALFAKKVRSVLTMLGVIIGVFSVVTLVSLGKGIQNYISDEFDALGTNLLFVSPGKFNIAGDPAAQLTANKLAEEHLDLISDFAQDEIVSVSPYVIVGAQSEYKTNSYSAEVTGVSADSVEIVNYELKQGRNFTPSEERAHARVAILGPIIQDELFGGQDPLGAQVKIADKSYEVIGVFAEKGSNYDDQIIVPYTTVMDEFEITNFSSIIAKARDAERMDIALKSVELALLRDLDEDDFSVLSSEDLLATIQNVLQILTFGLGAIAGISLLVGGIGIMNIMLVSVTERIREIGLRKAVGATSRVIGLQFMAESVLISVSGGLIGLVLGFLATAVARQFLRAEITLGAVVLAFGFSVFIGLIFGTYPAFKASKKDPIEALRYE